MNKKYEEILEKLKNNHFYPDTETTIGATSSKITSLRIYCPPILNVERKKRIEEVLEGFNVKVEWFPNDQYIRIKLI